MKVYQRLAWELRSAGVKVAFGLIGEDVAKFVLAMQAEGIRYVGARHENQACAMADAYSRITQRPVVAVVTGGPGFSNALTAINTAHRSGSSILVVTGKGVAAHKALPTTALCRTLGIASWDLDHPGDVAATATQVIGHIEAGHTGVLTIPINVFDAEDEAAALPAVRAPRVSEAIPPDRQQIAQAADFLCEPGVASAPAVLAGAGAVGAGPALRRLAELLGAPLATTLRAHGLFRGHPHDIGIAGTYASSLASGLLHASDVVLAFGASLNRFTTYGNELFPRARILQVDSDAAVLGLNLPVDPELAFQADSRLTAEAIVAELERRGYRAAPRRVERVRAAVADFDPRADFSDESRPGRVDARALADLVSRRLPERRTVVHDGGRHASYAMSHLAVESPRYVMQMTGAGSIGLAVGAGIGAAVARPEACTVVSCGDAGFMMALADVETAVRNDIPLLVMVLNDEALGAEVVYLEVEGADTGIARIPMPPIADVARALGAVGHTVTSLSDLDGLPLDARELGRPLVLDCHINGAIRSPSMEFLFSKAAPSTSSTLR